MIAEMNLGVLSVTTFIPCISFRLFLLKVYAQGAYKVTDRAIR